MVGFRHGPCLPYRFRFRRTGAEFKQLSGNFRREQVIYLAAKVLSFDRPEKRDLAEQRFEVITGQRANGEKVRRAGIKIGFGFGIGKDNSAFAAIGEDDPLRSLAVLFQQGQMFVWPSRSLIFQPIFDFLELLVKGGELLMNRETAFDQLGNLTLTIGCFGFHGPTPTRVIFFQFRRADERRQVPTSADIRR